MCIHIYKLFVLTIQATIRIQNDAKSFEEENTLFGALVIKEVDTFLFNPYDVLGRFANPFENTSSVDNALFYE